MISIKGADLHQWEINREIELTCVNIDELHWSKPSMTRAIPTKPESDEFASIPDILLQTSEKLTVHAMKEEKVVDVAVFNIKPRKKPSDYVYTPTEILNYETLATEIEKLKTSGGTGGVTDEQIKDVVEDYLEKNPPEGDFVVKGKALEQVDFELQETPFPYVGIEDMGLVLDSLQSKAVKTVNGIKPDLKGNVEIPTGGSGTTNYEELLNLPSINGVELKGGLSPEELGLQEAGDYAAASDIKRLEQTLQDILDIIQGGELTEIQISDIEQLIVSYFENKTVAEVER